jgi:mono/diheme cytochrome c family protein
MKMLFLLCVLLLVTIGCQPDQTDIIDEAEMISAGEQTYILNCGRCHHQDGSGYAPLFPTLAGNPIVTLHDPIPIIQITLHGQGSMPGFRGTLENDEIAEVLTYIRNAWGNIAPPVPPRQVR